MSPYRPVSSTDADAILGVALTGLARRQQAISNNIANIDTPNFKATEVRFENQLAAALDRRHNGLSLLRTQADHLLPEAQRLSQIQPAEQTVNSLTYRNDGNNVDIDAQMSALAETQLRYAAITQATTSRLGQLRTIITEGRR